MIEARTAVHTRDMLLRGTPVEVNVGDNFSLIRQITGIGDVPKTWAHILGAFSAMYSDTGDTSKQPLSRGRSVHNDSLPNEQLKHRTVADKLEKEIEANLNAIVPDKKLGDVVQFTGPGDLLVWTNQNANTKFSPGLEHNVASKEISDHLTQRGIGTLANAGIGVAVMLTELLRADDRLELSGDHIREIVTEQGQNLVTPMMSSQDDFEALKPLFVKELLLEPSDRIAESARKLITYDITDSQVVNVRFKNHKLAKTGDFGCPFLHTKPNALKPAWKIVVDTMWDEHLAPRVGSPTR